VFGLFRSKPKQKSPESPEPAEATGIIARKDEDGFPVIFKLVNELPDAPIREALPWLTVISWKYDGASRNGMPPNDVNQRMIILENAIDGLVAAGFMRHAYSRTGNGLKEFAYYIHDRDAFIGQFNAALAAHAPYPIAIDFYSDPEWQDFKVILESIAVAPGA